MLTYYTRDHLLHVSAGELARGELVPAFEKPERAEIIRARIEEVGLGPIAPPRRYPHEALTRVHDAGLVHFLETGYAEWEAAGRTGDALPFSWISPGMRDDVVPNCIDGKLSYYTFDVGAPLTKTSWAAIRGSADVALSGAEDISSGAGSVFALCRPPGHHASTRVFGGYCFLNNAAIAAQYLLDRGAARVAVLDVDYHHGNGTQEIFWGRADVLMISIHADPHEEYPFLSGHADEIGSGAGEGYTVNLPLALGSAWDVWGQALETACRRIDSYAPDAIIVSLGVDTYKLDPISQFRLDHEDYLRMGERIAKLGRPTLFVMEGGYAVAEIGINAVNVLQGFAA
jgi:acetoin utilization deacetylase AcuC-like enzyme